MHEQFADMDVAEITESIRQAFYNRDNVAAALLCEELQWRIEHTSV